MTEIGLVGLGYVGMQIALVATRAGHTVVGYDIDASVVERLRKGVEPHAGMSTDGILELLEAGFTIDSNPRVLGSSEVILLCVPTPLGEQNGPNLEHLTAAARAVSKHAKKGVLVVNESTSYPGTTRSLVKILEAGLGVIDDGFHLAFSSERVDPGRETPHLTEIPKVVGGVSEASTDRAVAFYQTIFDSVFRVNRAEEAEMSKLLENTYRQVNIALVNEMLRFSNEMNIDFWEVIDAAATKPFGFQSFRPGPGVGGHCIPIDPRYLSFHVKKSLGYSFRLVETAQEINDSMPFYVVQRVTKILNTEGFPLSKAWVVLIGLGYKAGVADLRESPSIQVAALLKSLGARVSGFDPAVRDEEFNRAGIERIWSLEPQELRADIAIVLNHLEGVSRVELTGISHRILDTRGELSNRGDDSIHML